MRVADRPLEQGEELRAARLVLDEREHLLELVDDEHEFRLVVHEEALDRAQQAALVLLELLEQPGRRTIRRAQQRCLELLERVRPGEHLHHVPALGAGKSALPEPRDEPRAHDRRLAAAARPHDRKEARLAETLDEMLGQHLPAEEVLRVALGECAQTLVWVARLQRGRSRGIERSAEGEVARDVLPLRPDGDDYHRLLEPFEPHRAALDVLETVDFAREMRHARARKHLARPGEGAEPGGEIERSAAVTAVDGHRLAGVEADPDGERQARIGDRLGDEALLQIGGRTQRLPSGVEDCERLVPRSSTSVPPARSIASRASSAKRVARRAAASSPRCCVNRV